MSFDVNSIIDHEKFIAYYLLSVDGVLRRREASKKKKMQTNDILLVRAAWLSIANNSRWYLTNYRKSIDSHPIIPLYECAFACRMLMETAADFRYYILSENKVKEVFLKEEKDFEMDFDATFCKLRNEHYNSDNGYIPPYKTMERIEKCFGLDGVGHYQTLCWNTHFSYMGYLIEKKSIINYKIRIYGLIYILASINTFLDSLISAGILSKTDVGNRMIKAQKHIDAIKEIIMNE